MRVKTRLLSKVATKAKRFARGLVHGSKTDAFKIQSALPTLILPTDSMEINIEEQHPLAVVAQAPADIHDVKPSLHPRSISMTAVQNLDIKTIENTPTEEANAVFVDSIEYLFDEALAPRFPDFPPNSVPPALLKILLFLLWCGPVGGTSLLS